MFVSDEQICETGYGGLPAQLMVDLYPSFRVWTDLEMKGKEEYEQIDLFSEILLGGQVESGVGVGEGIEAEGLVRRLAQRACQIPLALVFWPSESKVNNHKPRQAAVQIKTAAWMTTHQ